MQILVFEREADLSSVLTGQPRQQAAAAFAAVVERLQLEGADVRRYPLSRDPMPLLNQPAVLQLLALHGTTALPVVIVDGAIAATGDYPTYEDLRASRTALTPLRFAATPFQASGPAVVTRACG